MANVQWMMQQDVLLCAFEPDKHAPDLAALAVALVHGDSASEGQSVQPVFGSSAVHVAVSS